MLLNTLLRIADTPGMALLGEELRLQFGLGSRNNPRNLHLELSLAGGGTFRAAIEASGEAGLADLAPIARRLCDAVNTRVLASCEVSVCCRKGCGACCSYLVPLAIPEVLRLKQEIDSMPPRQSRRIQESMLAASRELLSHTSTAMAQEASPAETAAWYRSLGLRCPMAVEDFCGVYASRPLACREHFAVGIAVAGKPSDCPGSDVLPMPVSVLQALADVTSVALNQPVEAVVLPLAMVWLQSHSDLLTRTFPADWLMSQLVDSLQRQFTAAPVA